jgi:anthranilate synthase component I
VRTWPDAQRFRRLADAAPVVPVWCEWIGDVDSPLGAFARARVQHASAFLLESVVGGERWARYSCVGVGARARIHGRIEADGLRVQIEPCGKMALPELPREGRSMALVRAWMQAMRAEIVPELPPMWGGIVGVWGHDMVRAFEQLPIPAHHGPSPVPALELVATDVVLAFDALAQRVFVIAAAMPGCDGGLDRARAAAVSRIEAAMRMLDEQRGAPTRLALAEVPDPDPQPSPPWSRPGMLAAIERAHQHIRAGDVFQVVLSQAFEQPRAGLDPLDIYRVLRATNPAPYMYAMQLPSATLVGASPELLVRVDRDRTVTLRPIAGTRGRGRDLAEALALERELLADPKERAEHLMLVDLGRNDVGRIAATGSVAVTESFVVERYSRVMHIVSEVRARLREGLDALDALAAAFPAGTLSGAPKLRALQVIDALEPAPRGWYGGAVGYLGYDGAADFAICIRSVTATAETLRVQAGAGIVYDSVAAAEDAECRAKASAILRAIAIARHAHDDAGQR